MYKRSRMRKVCWFDQNSIEPEYKDQRMMENFVTERGKIVPRRLSGTCAKHQKALAIAVKRARYLALVPFVAENLK